MHGEVELGVVPFDGMQQFSNGDAGLQFLPDLAANGLLRRLARFDFAARKLPPVLPIARAPLCGEDAVLRVVDDGGGNGDMFHSLFVFVQYHQCGDDAGHPPAEGEQEHNEHRPAPPVDDGEGREKDGEKDAD